MAHKTDQELLAHTHNTSRFFVEHPQLAWATLAAVIVWGVYGYFHMPQRKDPDIPIRTAVASCQWPGATAQQVEQLITRPIEETVAQNKTIRPGTDADYGIRSISFPGRAVVYVQLAENTKDMNEEFNDINLRLQALKSSLPQGASAVQFQSNFGDTAALMLTVASPQADGIEVQVRAREMESAIRFARTKSQSSALSAVSILYTYPLELSEESMRSTIARFQNEAARSGWLLDSRIIGGNGYIGVDGRTSWSDPQIRTFLNNFVANELPASAIDPDVWEPIIVRDPSNTYEELSAVVGAKYTYAQLDDFTNLISRSLLRVPQTSRVSRSGVLAQQVYLEYSEEKLASYGLKPADLTKVLSTHNVVSAAGTVEAAGTNIVLNPSGQFTDAQSIGNIVVSQTSGGVPVYLRDLVQINNSYQSPAPLLNYYTWSDKTGRWHRSRAVTVAVFMRDGEQIQKFGQAVNAALQNLKVALPTDLILARTSDQPLQVKENIDLFMEALYEAVALVVLISLVGFWEWRSALLMALSIPITLAMTFGVAYLLGVDLQQVSIATLIIALGLLVDDPVVANDAIKRELAGGMSRPDAAWLGPTKLARAIVYATATNIIAYLPFLMITGNTGYFLHTLPVVMAAALVCSRIVSMTFVPLLGRYVLRPARTKELTLEEKRNRGFYGFYYRLVGSAITHRWTVLAVAAVCLILALAMSTGIKTQFFPDDVQYWSYVDIWLPNETPIARTDEVAHKAEQIIRRVTSKYQEQSKDREERGSPPLLKTLTSFVGGGSPRFWFSVTPQAQQANYAEILLQMNDKEATPQLMGPLQQSLSEEIPGAQIMVHQLQINPVEFPVEVRLSSTADLTAAQERADNGRLQILAEQAANILRTTPGTAVTQTDWLGYTPEASILVDSDKANISGITNQDVAASVETATTGSQVTTLRQGNREIPVLLRQAPEQRAQLSDLNNLYVASSSGSQKVPLSALSHVDMEPVNQRIRRQEQFRTIGVHAFPQSGVLPSVLLKDAMPALKRFQQTLPPGYQMVIGGERAKQRNGFLNLAVVLIISIIGIYAALLVQFDNAVKPFLVFAATPFGIAGALLALVLMHATFGFMAFLGIASLIGVIISHVIVLFDFIEEMHAQGEPIEQALRDAGIERLRPVLITVGATIFALFPLAIHGGPLWRPLCYAQMGGLAVATLITLLLVPVLYSIAVKDLGIIRWQTQIDAHVD